MKLSIIIPVYNKYNITLTCLKDICKLKDHEIIVVNDGGTDKTHEMLNNRDDIKYVMRSENGGFGKAISTGFKHATNDIVMILNNDIRVRSNHESWTREIIDFLQEHERYLVGPTAGYIDPDTFEFVYETNNPNQKFNYMSGWCLAALMDTWRELAYDKENVFDPRYHMYFEDCDIAFRAKELGIKFKMIHIPVVHFKKLSSKQKNVPKLYMESKRKFKEKWQAKKVR